MSDELKPCPFCGGEASPHGYQHFGKPLTETFWKGDRPITKAYFCNCPSCGVSNICSGIGYETREEAIAAWNRRATPTALAASPEVAALIAAERARIVQAITFGFPPEDRFIRMTDVLAAIESAALRGEKEPK